MREVGGGSSESRHGERTLHPDVPGTTAADGRPDGNKKAKASAPTTERLHSSIERCIADAKTHAIQREEKCEARWSQMMEKQNVKIELLKTNVAAKKRNTDMAFLMSADPTTMDDKVKAWYMGQRDLILNEIPAPTPTPTPTMTPTPKPTPPTESSTTKSSPSSVATSASSLSSPAPPSADSVVVQVDDNEPAV